jgi:hypothetical protein
VQHFLCTQFALPFPKTPRHPHYKTWLDKRPNWLEERFELFEKYTLPSIQAQTEKNFRWLLMCSRKHPQMNDAAIRRLESYAPDAEVFWLDIINFNGQFGHWPEFANALRPLVDDEWVTTTRLDSDDIVSRHFIQRIREGASEKEGSLGFKLGYMLEGDVLYSRGYLRGPFTSWVERAEKLKTVWHRAHLQFRRSKDVGQKKRNWIQVVHGANLLNGIARAGLKNGIPISPEVRKDFIWKD